MDPERKVVSIAPAPTEEQATRAGYGELWRELVTTKAKLAELLNARAQDQLVIDELRQYVRRHVKRLDAIASRLERARG